MIQHIVGPLNWTWKDPKPPYQMWVKSRAGSTRLDFTHEHELWSTVSHARPAARDTSGTQSGTQPWGSSGWAAGKPCCSSQRCHTTSNIQAEQTQPVLWELIWETKKKNQNTQSWRTELVELKTPRFYKWKYYKISCLLIFWFIFFILLHFMAYFYWQCLSTFSEETRNF